MKNLQRPHGKKLHLKDCSSTVNGKKYTRYAIAISEKLEGHNQKKIITYVGTLTKEEAQSYRLFLHAMNNEKPKMASFMDVESLIYDTEKQYLNVKIMHELWNRFGLNTLFSNTLKTNQKLTTQHIALILTINRLFEPMAKYKTVQWLEKTLLADIMGIDASFYNKDKIFHELSNIHQSKHKIEQSFIEFSRGNFAKNKQEGEREVFYYDGTTSWFEGSQSNYAQLAKEQKTMDDIHMYNESISLQEFYETIDRNSVIVRLKAPNNINIYKQKEGDERLKTILTKLKLENLYPTSDKTPLKF